MNPRLAHFTHTKKDPANARSLLAFLSRLDLVGAKSITRGCSVLNAQVWTGPEEGDRKTEFAHNCTTETGSSGGPVYSNDGKIVGIHHLGVSLSIGVVTGPRIGFQKGPLLLVASG